MCEIQIKNKCLCDIDRNWWYTLQCGSIITTSHSLRMGPRYRLFLWVQILTYVLPQSLQCCMWYYFISDCIIIALDYKYSCGVLHTSAYKIRHLSWNSQRQVPLSGTHNLSSQHVLALIPLGQTGGYLCTSSKQVNSKPYTYSSTFTAANIHNILVIKSTMMKKREVGGSNRND